MTPRLTPRAAAVLAYVEAHPGCTTQEIKRGLGWTDSKTRDSLYSLYSRRLVGRQYSLFGSPLVRWYLTSPSPQAASLGVEQGSSDKERSMA